MIDLRFELTWEEVKKLSEGSTCAMACRECESHEVHEKKNGKWICQNCGCKDIEA